jgi:hypothetical protein
MSYYFNVSNFFGVCELDPLSNTYIPVRVESGTDDTVIVALGVICGITTITAIVQTIRGSPEAVGYLSQPFVWFCVDNDII